MTRVLAMSDRCTILDLSLKKTLLSKRDLYPLYVVNYIHSNQRVHNLLLYFFFGSSQVDARLMQQKYSQAFSSYFEDENA